MTALRLVPLALAFLLGIVSDLRDLDLAALGICCCAALGMRGIASPLRLYVLAAIILGMIDARALAHPPAMRGDVHTRRFSAVVVEAEARGAQGIEATLRLDDGSRASAFFEDGPIGIGTRLLVRAEREPFDEPRNPGEASLRELQAERGIAWRLVHLRVLARGPPDARDATLWMARARAWASTRLHATLDEPGATILAGALWGERGALPPELRAEFQDTGTVHILVTAGLHLGVVAALAIGLLQFLRCGRVSASLGTIVIVWAYAVFSGAHLPSIRAATMLSFALLARAAGRDPLSWNALAAAAIVVAAFRPMSVLSVSFGLSFSCVAAILSFAKPITKGLERFGIPHLACEVLGVSVAAQLGTWPLSAATFLVIAPYAPLANAAVVPVVGVAMLAGAAALALAPFPSLSALASNIVVSLLDWIVGSVALIGALPGAHAIATPPPAWTLVVYTLALVTAAITLARGRPWIAAISIVLASALCLWPPRPANHDLVVTAIDVGQADALLVRTPSGHAYLIDAGGRLERGGATANVSDAEDIGERIVVPFLIRSGIHHIDGIILSHPHGDHAGGISPVLRSLGADRFADSGQVYSGHAFRDALAVAALQHVPILEPRAGDIWRTDDGVAFRFYGPSDPYIHGSRNDINNNSLVLRLEYGRFHMLFMGDAGSEAEERLLDQGADLHADVLKVGHHGSAYSSTPHFIAAVSPQVAVISVGRHNVFGHPATSTLDVLARAGAQIYRTDDDGAITIRSDGSSFSASPFLADYVRRFSASSSSRLRGQSAFSNRDKLRSASSTPPV